MKVPRHIEEYNKKYAIDNRPLVCTALDGIAQVVVIPVLAEKNSLFATLASLSRNSSDELRRTLILCVINNRGNNIASHRDIKNNQDTIRYLYALMRGLPVEFSADCGLADDWQAKFCPAMRLAYIDASSPGWEMTDKCGGVGMARKIGMDAALTVFDYAGAGEKLIISLDADTLVEENYLTAIRDFFVQGKSAAVVDYAHQIPVGARGRLAICTYELFLRYYVLGLRYAGSPYAFHTIGSTIVCTADAYIAVGGMNRRDAAEDFYFLNKLAKYKEVGRIRNTTVYPSARPSRRVPFGTGRRIVKFLEGGDEEFLLYDPRVFLLLRRWLDVMKSSPDRQTAEILTFARCIDPLLLSFLERNQFSETWERIRKNSKGQEMLLRHFHCWFDAFKTLKLIHFLTDHGYPLADMFRALEALLKLMGGEAHIAR